MERLLTKSLLRWKTEPTRKPLIVRGARQVGKSHCVREFGRANFKHYIELNFEKEPALAKLFDGSLSAQHLTQAIARIRNIPVERGHTLIFFDEIQNCPKALTALRYFYEDLPELHIIAAGSLIEFALESEKISIPVGRVESRFLYPMSFAEYLAARGEHAILEFIQSEASLSFPPDEATHHRGLTLIREYAAVGGMPEAVYQSLHNPDVLRYRTVQSGLLQAFRDDFGKYARQVKHPYLDHVFSTAPAMLSQDYKYSNVDRDTPSRAIKDALLLLEKAGVLYRIRATSASGLPLEAFADDRRFKIAFLDVGLAQAALGLDAQLALDHNFHTINAGAIAEQLVAQELRANASDSESIRLFYWARPERGSSAEVDLLYQFDRHILPVEVKSGATGRLRSLRMFLETYKVPFGIRISRHQLSFTDDVLSIPIYLTSSLKRIVADVITRK